MKDENEAGRADRETKDDGIFTENARFVNKNVVAESISKKSISLSGMATS